MIVYWKSTPAETKRRQTW